MSEFIFQGKRYTLTLAMVEASLDGVEPEPVQQLAAGVAGRWYPVKQAFVRPLGLKNSDVNSRVAFDHLNHAGVPVHDTKADGPLPPAPPAPPVTGTMPGRRSPGGSRSEALVLAVEMLKGTQGVTAEQVTGFADVLERWLRAA